MRRPELLVGIAEPLIVETAPVLRRRRWTAGVTLGMGTVLLATTFRLPHGSGWFPVLTVLLAATWIAGALLSGPIRVSPPGATPRHTLVAAAGAVGVLTFGAFVAARALGQQLPVVSGALDTVLDTADAGPILLVLSIALLNAVAEELFFRGAVFSALEPWRPALTSTIVYATATAATANIALVAAAAVMGTVLSLERISTRGVLAPIVTHLTWSTLMLLALPR